MAIGWFVDVRLANDEADDRCLLEIDNRGVLFKSSLLEELTVVNSLSGVSFLITLSVG